MGESTISYKGKVKVSRPLEGKSFLKLLNYLVNDCGFKVGKIKKDEVELTKKDEFTDTEIKIEIECSEKDYEIEIKAVDLDTIKKLTEDAAAQLE